MRIIGGYRGDLKLARCTALHTRPKQDGYPFGLTLLHLIEALTILAIGMLIKGRSIDPKLEFSGPPSFFQPLLTTPWTYAPSLSKIGAPLIPSGILTPNEKHGPGVDTSRLVKLSGKNCMIVPTEPCRLNCGGAITTW